MKELLPWIIPPLVGAVIGYITNVVAVKMLFRPLKQIKVFGIPVPFTPGILPRQRHKLAQSIGGMVERELLSPEILRARLSRPEVKESLKNALSGYTEKIFAMPPDKWLPGISDYVIAGAEAAYPKVSEALIRFLRQKDIRAIVESQSRILLTKAILKMNAFQRFFISAGQFDMTLEEKIPEIIEDLYIQLEKLLKYEGEKKVIQTLEKEIATLPEKHPDLCLEKILVPGKSWTGESPKARLDSFLAEKILATATEQTEQLLKTINVKSLVSERIDSLDMLRVERIILDVMADQLWWINIFGGILGALIGFSQVILSLFL
jgi:uncharacterized membrane protein YheB (UPF0754 family)